MFVYDGFFINALQKLDNVHIKNIGRRGFLRCFENRSSSAASAVVRADQSDAREENFSLPGFELAY